MFSWSSNFTVELYYRCENLSSVILLWLLNFYSDPLHDNIVACAPVSLKVLPPPPSLEGAALNFFFCGEFAWCHSISCLCFWFEVMQPCFFSHYDACQTVITVFIKPCLKFYKNGLVLLFVCICQLSWEPASADLQLA